MSSASKYELVVGLEVHIQLLTASKLFVGDANTYGSEPNSQVSVITLAHPGTLPKLNRQAVEFAIRMGLACDSTISRTCIFDRKNYFYPDLPKGYQLTQDRTPICRGGKVEISTKEDFVTIPLNRIHLEEDAGKSNHDDHSNDSLIDLNRAGVPLIELVTEPAIKTAEEAMAFLTEIRQIVRYLEICDGNMEQGSLRCDANISVRKIGEPLGKKVEVKNMNPIRNVGRAINHEFNRQVEILDNGEEVISETRLFDANTGITSGMRTKEALNDYRYFPEPDLSPFTVSEEWLEQIKQGMPDTPKIIRKKLISEFLLSEYDASVLTSDKKLVSFFLVTSKHTEHYKKAANWIIGPIKSRLNESDADDVELPIQASQLAEMINGIEDGVINHSSASKQVFPYLCQNPHASLSNAIEILGLEAAQQDDISDVILKVVAANPSEVMAYQKGKKNLMGMFMGEVMKETKGSADPKQANELLRQALEKRN